MNMNISLQAYPKSNYREKQEARIVRIYMGSIACLCGPGTSSPVLQPILAGLLYTYTLHSIIQWQRGLGSHVTDPTGVPFTAMASIVIRTWRLALLY